MNTKPTFQGRNEQNQQDCGRHSALALTSFAPSALWPGLRVKQARSPSQTPRTNWGWGVVASIPDTRQFLAPPGSAPELGETLPRTPLDLLPKLISFRGTRAPGPRVPLPGLAGALTSAEHLLRTRPGVSAAALLAWVSPVTRPLAAAGDAASIHARLAILHPLADPALDARP